MTEKLEALLPVFGHRNWIVVADSAYPAHCAPGIETAVAADEHVAVLRAVLDRLDAAPHLSAEIYLDAELAAVPEADAHGISAYREALEKLLAGRLRRELPHDEIIARLDHVAGRFRVLIIKTPLRLPYTSVFIELGCGYWTAEAEKRLRAVPLSPPSLKLL